MKSQIVRNTTASAEGVVLVAKQVDCNTPFATLTRTTQLARSFFSLSFFLLREMDIFYGIKKVVNKL